MNKQHLALSLSVGILGGISVFLASNILSSVYLIWVGFIAWGLFFKNGGDNDALKMTITAGIYGAVLAGLFFVLSGAINIGGALNAPIWIAITVFALIFGTQIPLFSCAPTAVCGYAATAKSTTVLNYCNIGNNLIDYICDTTKEKIGKFSPGTHIPIVPVNHFKENIPDVAFLFAWNHKEEIFSKEKEFKDNGGVWFSHVTL